MRIIVISDTHKDFGAMYNIFEDNKTADLIIFLGDGEKEFDEVCELYPDIKTLKVSGNCDSFSFTPEIDTTFVQGKKIIFTHGHNYGVKYGDATLLSLAEKNNADIILFGHTHQRYESYSNGIYIFNPGSASQPRDFKPASYGFIDITNAGIVCGHKELR